MRLSGRGSSPKLIVACAVALVLSAAPVRAANVDGSALADDLFGTNSPDVIRGLDGDDFIFGKSGADRLAGGGGNDSVFGGRGADVMDGGAGDDTLYDDDSRGGDLLRGRAGNDTLYSIDGKADTLSCGPGTDVAFGDRNDTFKSCERKVRRNGRFGGGFVRLGSNSRDLFDRDGDTDDLIFARAGSDNVLAGDGDDLLFGGGGGDFLSGEDDDDVFVDDDSAAGDNIRPGDGRDLMFVADGARSAVDCSSEDDDGDNDVVYADLDDQVIDCGTVIAG